MKPLSTILILTVVAFASACSKNNYAQLEPNDNYYKNTGSGYGQYSASAGSSSVADYQSQHSPVISSTNLGSPTIQQYEETFYDSNQNPDLAGQDFNYVEGTQQDYYVENYGAQDLVQTEVIPQTNNYYYNGNSPFYTNSYPTGDYFSMSFYMSSYYSMRPWYDPFNPYFSSDYYSARLGRRPYRRGWYYFPNSYSSFYGLGTVCYSGSQAAYTYNGNNYNSNAASDNGNTIYNSNNGYTNYNSNNGYEVYGTAETDNSYGGRVTNGNPITRSSVSSYTNSDNSKRRREDYNSGDNQGGRISGDNRTGNGEQGYVAGSKRRSDTGAINNAASEHTRNTYQRKAVGSSNMTIQQNNSQRRNVLNTGNNKSTKQNTSDQNNSSQRRRSNYYTNRTNQNSYTAPSNGNRSRSSTNQSRSKTSYSGTRNNSPSRSYSAPSRPSSVQRSTPTRSTPTRSSSTQRSSSPKPTGGTRSSSSSSGKRKN